MFRYINWPTTFVVGVVMSSKSVLGGKIRPVTPVLFISTRAALAWTEEKCSLRNEKLKANRAS